jgi:hypothetical protein
MELHPAPSQNLHQCQLLVLVALGTIHGQRDQITIVPMRRRAIGGCKVGIETHAFDSGPVRVSWMKLAAAHAGAKIFAGYGTNSPTKASSQIGLCFFDYLSSSVPINSLLGSLALAATVDQKSPQPLSPDASLQDSL